MNIDKVRRKSQLGTRRSSMLRLSNQTTTLSLLTDFPKEDTDFQFKKPINLLAAKSKKPSAWQRITDTPHLIPCDQEPVKNLLSRFDDGEKHRSILSDKTNLPCYPESKVKNNNEYILKNDNGTICENSNMNSELVALKDLLDENGEKSDLNYNSFKSSSTKSSKCALFQSLIEYSPNDCSLKDIKPLSPEIINNEPIEKINNESFDLYKKTCDEHLWSELFIQDNILCDENESAIANNTPPTNQFVLNFKNRDVDNKLTEVTNLLDLDLYRLNELEEELGTIINKINDQKNNLNRIKTLITKVQIQKLKQDVLTSL